MRFRLTLLIPCFFFVPGIISGQEEYRILHWGIESGLSQGINQKIIRDKEGFLWATSYEGANRFDGKTFRNFYSFPRRRNSIRGVETAGLVEDSLHNIWIGSGDGLNRFDPIADSIITFLPDIQPGNKVRYIVPIAATKKEVICFDITGSLTAYDIHSFKRRTISNQLTWHSDYVYLNNSWYDPEHDRLWMPAAAGIVSVEVNTGKTSFSLPEWKATAILYDPQSGTMTIGTDNGIVEWNPKNGTVNHTKELRSIPLGRVTCLAADRFGNKWIGTEQQGIFIISPGKPVSHLVKTDDPNSIGGNKINTIFCDNTGIVWISVGTNGIDQLIPGNHFLHYSERAGLKDNLSSNVVRCFLEDDEKRIWIATQGGGINVFDPATRHFSFLTTHNLPGLPFDFIRFMVRDRSRAWIGTERGLCRMEMASRRATPIRFTDSSGRSLNDPYIEQIIPFRNNEWLIATKEFGLFTLDNDSTLARQLPYAGNKHVFYVSFVNDLLVVSLWDKDPKIFRITGDEWKEVPSELTSFTITYVLHDERAHRYWIGTLKGLLEVDEQLKIIHHYTREDGLSNHYIYAMVQDGSGLLWISTNKGLSQFDPRTKKFKVFTPSDGLQGYEYNAKAAFIASDGALYFGGTNGFDIIRPAESQLQPEESKFYIRELLVNNVTYFGRDLINQPGAISLPYTGNNITIQTGMIDFVNSGNNKIRYKLEGSDPDWKTADRDFVINYSRLSPGPYTFRATAAGIDNEWSGRETTIRFSIAQPWWQTWQFRLILAGLLIGALILFIRMYYRRQLQRQRIQFEKQQAVEHERTRIATDMHDDLGAGLSRIKFLSETIGIKRQRQEPIEEDVYKIREYSHDMIDKMGEIVWALNEKNDSLSDLLAYSRAYAVEYLSQEAISTTVKAPDQFDTAFVSGEFRRNIFLTIKEALHNIVKHSQATAVEIEFRTGAQLYIRIHDNGIGFREEKVRPFSNGLSNMRKRMESLGGTWEIRDEDGSTVILSVPIP